MCIAGSKLLELDKSTIVCPRHRVASVTGSSSLYPTWLSVVMGIRIVSGPLVAIASMVVSWLAFTGAASLGRPEDGIFPGLYRRGKALYNVFSCSSTPGSVPLSLFPTVG
ncbi:hypothetical protein LXG23DRAFT_34650 [Yarrowia lipolytica]|nr:hypothetical protein LXG23DRAFT_34650 [Yarrowia lipolytica]